MNETAQSSILAEILQGSQTLVQEHEQAVSNLKARTSSGENVADQMDQIQIELEAASKIRDERMRNTRIKVLTANFEELRKDSEQEERDLAKAVFGMNAIVEGIYKEYEKMGELNEQEKQLIGTAKNRLEEAKTKLTEANQKWFFKESAVASAQAEVAKADQTTKDAESEAKRRARQRLLSANFEQSLQELQLRANRTIQILTLRRNDHEKQLEAVSVRKVAALKTKEEAAQALSNLDQELNKKEAELLHEEEAITPLENGSPEHATQTTKISQLKAIVEDIRGKRNSAFTLHQSKEKFSKELETHEQVHQRLKDNVIMWITAIKSDTEERVVTFRSRLEAQKGLSDVSVAKELDELSSMVDQKNLEFMVAAAGAADRLRMEKLEKHPGRMKEIEATQAAFAENIALIREREIELVNYYKDNYGIDPTKSSFFHYAGKEDAQTPTE